MAAKKKQQTHAKRARELAVKERRERKQAKRAAAVAERNARAAGATTADGGSGGFEAEGDGETETAASEWIR